MSEKLSLNEKIKAVDLNMRELWDALDPEQQKTLKGELFILNRYISNVKTNNRDVVDHYIMTVNHYYNKNWFDLQKHPKLLWMLLCMCNYNGSTTFYHEWIGLNKPSPKNKLVQVLAEYHPTMKMDDIHILAETMSTDDIKELLTDIGWSTTDIKKFIK